MRKILGGRVRISTTVGGSASEKRVKTFDHKRYVYLDRVGWILLINNVDSCDKYYDI